MGHSCSSVTGKHVHDFCPIRNQLPERLWERQIPADQHANLSDWCIEDFMHIAP